MKKLVLVLAIAIGFVSCKKEEVEPEVPAADCSCGVIVSDGIDSSGDTFIYYLNVENDCSGHIMRFNVTYNYWLTHFVGDQTCGNPSW
jgi:hypothetical protein